MSIKEIENPNTTKANATRISVYTIQHIWDRQVWECTYTRESEIMNLLLCECSANFRCAYVKGPDKQQSVRIQSALHEVVCERYAKSKQGNIDNKHAWTDMYENAHTQAFAIGFSRRYRESFSLRTFCKLKDQAKRVAVSSSLISLEWSWVCAKQLRLWAEQRIVVSNKQLLLKLLLY